MAKNVYIGLSDSLCAKIKKIYIGDENGKAVKIKKVYIGDENGKARICYEGATAVTELLGDFNFTDNGNGTFTITGWKGTLDGANSTELIIPDDPSIIL